MITWGVTMKAFTRKANWLSLILVVFTSFGLLAVGNVAAEDEELTAKSYIVPGLGDAGDLAFGEKMQD